MLDDRFECTPFFERGSAAHTHPFCITLSEAEPEPLLCLGLAAGEHRALLTNQGARLLVWQGADRVNSVVGPRTARELLADQGAMGVTAGRVCNRIRHGELPITPQHHIQLPCNDGLHHLHGGPKGFHTKLWKLFSHAQYSDRAEVAFVLHSPSGDQSYPGAVTSIAKYTLQDTGELMIAYESEVSEERTPINLTNHTYWNLDPAETNILTHRMQSDCDRYLETDPDAIPTGQIRNVAGSIFDFRRARSIGPEIPPPPKPGSPGGYDLFYLRPEELRSSPNASWQRLALVENAEGSRTLELWSDQWGFQFYTGNYLSSPYRSRQGLCLEASGLVDAVHHPHFPSIWVDPGETLRQRLCYKLGVSR